MQPEETKRTPYVCVCETKYVDCIIYTCSYVHVCRYAGLVSMLLHQSLCESSPRARSRESNSSSMLPQARNEHESWGAIIYGILGHRDSKACRLVPHNHICNVQSLASVPRGCSVFRQCRVLGVSLGHFDRSEPNIRLQLPPKKTLLLTCVESPFSLLKGSEGSLKLP